MLKVIVTPNKILFFPREGLSEKHPVTAGMARRHVTHTGTAQSRVGN